MPWIPTPNGGAGYTCTQPDCDYVTDGDPADILVHRMDHLFDAVNVAPTAPFAPHAVLAQAEAILRADLERARKLWYPTA